jgi:hypothetical protein
LLIGQGYTKPFLKLSIKFVSEAITLAIPKAQNVKTEKIDSANNFLFMIVSNLLLSSKASFIHTINILFYFTIMILSRYMERTLIKNIAEKEGEKALIQGRF